MKRKSKYISNEFIRWGGVNSVNQKYTFHGDKSRDGYHSPPFGRGIYAFPLKCVDKFLSYHRIERNDKMHKFKYNGEIWHHLSDFVKPNEILSMNGTWVLTSMNAWRKAFSKSSINDRLGCDIVSGGNINEIRSGVSGFFLKYHYEVFIPNMK